MSREWEGFTDEDLRRMKGLPRGRGRPPDSRKPRGRSEGCTSPAAVPRSDPDRVPDVQSEDTLPTWNEQKSDGRNVEGLSAVATSKPVAVVSASSINVVVDDSGTSDTNKTNTVDQEEIEVMKQPDEIELSDDPSL
jgi:hypothetical protein